MQYPCAETALTAQTLADIEKAEEVKQKALLQNSFPALSVNHWSGTLWTAEAKASEYCLHNLSSILQQQPCFGVSENATFSQSAFAF